MTEALNPDVPSVAYHAGRMMAVFAGIQEAALGKDVGAGVIQRYYTSASTSPALVIGKLTDLSQHHLAKMDKGLAIYFTRQLEEISGKIGTKIPSILTLEQKTEFALGYFQQSAALHTPKNSKEDTDNAN